MSSKKGNKTTRLVDLISALSKTYVDSLTVEQLAEASRKLFKLISLCSCIKSNQIYDVTHHTCSELFSRNDTVHIPECKCCQTKLLLYYLSLCLEHLDEQNQLPEFSRNALTKAKVRDRTFGFTTSKSKLRFRIIRHLNAWRNLSQYEEIIQEWEFDFEKLNLLRIY